MSSQGQQRDALFNLSKDQFATVCKFVSELEPSSFGNKMFSIKLCRPTFTDQVCTCFGSSVGILKPPRNGQELQSFSNLKIGVCTQCFQSNFKKPIIFRTLSGQHQKSMQSYLPCNLSSGRKQSSLKNEFFF